MNGHVVGNSFKWPVESRREKEASCKCIYTHVRLCPRTFMMYTHSLERIENSILQNTHTARPSLVVWERARTRVCVRVPVFLSSPACISLSLAFVHLYASLFLVDSLHRRYVLHLVVKGLNVHRPVSHDDLALRIHVPERVLNPVDVVALGEVLPRVRAA